MISGKEDVITTKTIFQNSLDRTANAPSTEEYEHRFLAAQAETVKSFRNNSPPLPEQVLHDRTKAKRFFGVYQMTHNFFAKMFPSYLMNVAAKCPYQDVRREILKDCWDEEVGDADARGMCHIEVLYHDAELLGISREEVEAFEPTPVFIACEHALENLSRVLLWEGGYAAIGGLEAIRVAISRGYLTKEEFPDLCPGGAPMVEELCGIPKGSLMMSPLHQAKDQVHGGGVLGILKRYAVTREMQELTFWAIKTSRSLRMITERERRRVAQAAIGLPADALIVT